MLARAQMEEEIERKRREVEEQVNKERAQLEARVEALQLECDEARAQADSMVAASDKLSSELVKVHEQYDEANQKRAFAKAETEAAKKMIGEDGEEEEAAGSDAGGEKDEPDDEEPP